MRSVRLHFEELVTFNGCSFDDYGGFFKVCLHYSDFFSCLNESFEPATESFLLFFTFPAFFEQRSFVRRNEIEVILRCYVIVPTTTLELKIQGSRHTVLIH